MQSARCKARVWSLDGGLINDGDTIEHAGPELLRGFHDYAISLSPHLI
jgi:hypothetical protein